MSSLVKSRNLFPSLNPIFDDFFSKDLFDWNDKNFSALGSTLPSVNVKETDEDFQIELAAPGMKKEDFKIEVDKSLLTISSEKKEEKEEKDKKGNYTRREFNYQSFSRSFSLPQAAAQDKIDATYSDGILHVSIKKKEKEPLPEAKKIDVK